MRCGGGGGDNQRCRVTGARLWTGEHSKTQRFVTVEARYATQGIGGRAGDGGARDSLDVDVGADDILDLLGKRVLEGERAGSNPDPLSGFGAKAVHDREDLALQLHHLEQVQHPSGLKCLVKGKKQV